MADPFAIGAADIIESEVTVDVTFTPAGGAAVATRAGVMRNVELTDRYGTVSQFKVLLTLLRAHVGLPKNGDTITIGADTYRVVRILNPGDHLVAVACS